MATGYAAERSSTSGTSAVPLPQRIELKQTGLTEDGGVAHIMYLVLR